MGTPGSLHACEPMTSPEVRRRNCKSLGDERWMMSREDLLLPENLPERWYEWKSLRDGLKSFRINLLILKIEPAFMMQVPANGSSKVTKIFRRWRSKHCCWLRTVNWKTPKLPPEIPLSIGAGWVKPD